MSSDVIDLSNGSTNPYMVEARHRMIPACSVCRTFTPVLLDGFDYFRFFVEGKLHVQQVFPYLSAEQREILISGTHPACWTRLFAEQANEEEI